MTLRGYVPVFTVHLACLIGLALGDAWAFVTVGYVFGLVPLIDQLLPRDRRNPDAGDLERLEAAPAFRLLLYGAVIADTLVLALALRQAHTFGLAAFVGHALGVGLVMGGVGITVAHELLHKRGVVERAFAHVALLTVCYAHFVIEHVFGHHVRAATPEDAATARRDESVYDFVPRSVRESWRSAWQIEAERLARLGASPWSPRNAMLWYAALPVALMYGVVRVFGPWALAFFVAQSVVSFVLLEVVNYIEHYGLVRARRDSAGGERGGYEPFSYRHAWDSDHWLSNRLLFRLARHADHHRHAMRPYQVLRHLDESPKLPGGYPAMMLLSLAPPLWRAVIHPRLDR